jgi:hypothetical protein
LQHQGWAGYFSGGPNREPLYPWFISMVLRLADGLKMDYTPVLLVGQVLVFLGTLWLLEKLSRNTGMGPGWRAGILCYAVFSPALVYTVFTEWSEIVACPLVLSVIFACTGAWRCLEQARKAGGRTALAWGAALGLSVLALTAVKAVMEVVAVFLVVPWVVVALRRRHKTSSRMALFVLLGFLAVYATGTTFYKWQNWRHNGQFVLTNRGSWALYGNTARRTAKLSSLQWRAAVFSIPTNGAECGPLLKSPEACQYWTFVPSDKIGHQAAEQLRQQGLPLSKVDSALVAMSLAKIAEHPFQSTVLMCMEAMKFMFWEYNAWPQFAVYPAWLRHIYENRFLYAFLHYGMALLTSTGFVFALRSLAASPEIFFMTFFALLYIFFHSFFYCSGRYAMPLSPLFLILIAFFFKSAIAAAHGKNHP